MSCGLTWGMGTARAAGTAEADSGVDTGAIATPSMVALRDGTDAGEPGATTRNVWPHFGQRIFCPVGGTRRSSTWYGALHASHSTLSISGAEATTLSRYLAGRMTFHPGTREPEFVEISGAREHNLAIDHLRIPKRQLVVFTGPSGSGKSSLAFDTLYAEGQRRYVETLSSYARQFLGQLDRPKVDHLRGLSPTIAIEQKSASGNPRSTVGTITEIYDYLRVLYAKVGEQHCPACGKKVRSTGTAAILKEVAALGEGVKVTLLAPLVTHRKGEFRELFERSARARLRAGDDRRHRPRPRGAAAARQEEEAHGRPRGRPHHGAQGGATPAWPRASSWPCARGRARCGRSPWGAAELAFSQARTCCGVAFAELSPQSFSFNSPLGMCPACTGLGQQEEVDPALVIPDPHLSIRGGAIAPWAAAMARGEGWTARIVEGVARAFDIDLDTPWNRLPRAKQRLVLYGAGADGARIAVHCGKAGSLNQGTLGDALRGGHPEPRAQVPRDVVRGRSRELPALLASAPLRSLRRASACRPSTLAVKVAGKSIAELTGLTVVEAARHLDALALPDTARAISEGAIREIQSRLRFLLDVGLDYLTLDRAGPSLSGGEAQRIRLASQLGSELSGVMYVLDEPSIGLHPRDNARLIDTLRRLRDLGNSVIVVEHDEETIRAADHVVDFGPGAGHDGGQASCSAALPTSLRRATA